MLIVRLMWIMELFLGHGIENIRFIVSRSCAAVFEVIFEPVTNHGLSIRGPKYSG